MLGLVSALFEPPLDVPTAGAGDGTSGHGPVEEESAIGITSLGAIFAGNGRCTLVAAEAAMLRDIATSVAPG
jgi:hypothetical protein